jgi:hypothetical protein
MHSDRDLALKNSNISTFALDLQKVTLTPELKIKDLLFDDRITVLNDR